MNWQKMLGGRAGGRSECPQHTKNHISNAIVTFILFCVKISDVKLQKNEMLPYITVMKWKFFVPKLCEQNNHIYVV